MTLYLNKRHGDAPNAKLFTQLDDNAKATETEVNLLNNKLKYHESSTTAHKSSQIDHGGLSVSTELETMKKRFANVITKADGTNVKEVLDLRINREGKEFDTANERVVEIEKSLADLDASVQKEYGFDYTTIPPVYHTSLNLADKTVLQCFVIDEKTGDIYATQVGSGNTDQSQNFVITRMNKNGVMLDSMTVIHGGHGTTIGLERENDRMYIWSNYDVVDSNGSTIGHDLVRFPYTAGATINGGNGGIKRFNKFTELYAIPVIDQQNGLIALRLKDSNDDSVVQLRKLNDVKNGIDNLLGEVTVPNDLHYLQGFTIDGYDLYWYTGDTNNVTYPAELSLFSFKDGKLKKRITCDFGRGPDGKYEGDFREPESVFLYKDPMTGKKSLFAAIATGSVGKRLAKVYAYHSKDNAAAFATDLSQGFQGYPLTKNNGNAMRLPDGITKLKDFRQVGYYYMTTAETSKLTDHPAGGDAGWWFHVAPADISGSVIQTLTRNSTGRPIKIYTRVVTNAGVAGDWTELMSNQALDWTNLPLKNGASNPDSDDKLQYAINGGLVYLRGRVKIPETDGVIFAVLPAGARPGKAWFTGCQVAGTSGDRKIDVRANGEIVAWGFNVNSVDKVTYTYLNIVFPIG
ncbi:teichoic acid biosynthesis protein [Bacillus subtilis]|uniref:phage baseplate protein n=1 Tax=Bacillus subtilis TaxID=1423 RepID=UPI0027A0F683|nr:teichoic acid biosynthesis protein [Bacillus subtilis]MEC2401693.1 teichoic acid biosynthesis protein [Bacillus subtilis]MED4660145.1 teichoic acid biosynthesis protein [Bacillus subtilis]MED4664450.1 teichoic acid biosynthesis protein [Bacillus subtilis]WEZ27419.1 teichoic acid biosynthesis protein [Bacillus subtilis]